MANTAVFSCVLGAALLAPVLALAQTTHTDKPFVDARSGMVFPVTIGEFKRFRETLDPQGASAGYGYADRQGRIAATLIVFAPSQPLEPDFCNKYIDAGPESLRKAGPDVQTMPPPEAPPIAGYPAAAGIAKRYSHPITKGGPPAYSDHYYYCNVGGKWIVQYDFAYLASFDATREIASFIHDLKWTIVPGL